MKKTTKILSAIVLCAIMIVMGTVTAFATNYTHCHNEPAVYTENHNVLDCTNRYKDNNGLFHFTLKVPKGSSLSSINIHLTLDNAGGSWYCYTLSDLSSKITYLRSDDKSDYYELVTSSYGSDGTGVKLYCYYSGSNYSDGYYMATDNGYGQTTEGRGYWLSK